MALTKKLSLNPAQRLFHDVSYFVKVSYQVWGRGTGKSSFGIGIVIRNAVHFLPRSKWLIVAESYKAMLENTLPSTIRALEMLGYYRDVHYVIGIKPPKLWQSPYEPPTRGFTNAITFFNGTTFQLVSQDSSATSPRGLNSDGVIVDEALNLDKENYDQEIAPTIRANQQTFKKIPFHLGQFFFSSMPYGSDAEWLTENIDYYIKDGNDNQQLMAMLIEHQLEFLKASSDNRRQELWNECVQIRRSIKWYPKVINRRKVFYQESNTFDNIRHMGFNYVNNLYRQTSELQFMTEIMNMRMNKVEGAFYTKFNRLKHAYKRLWSDESVGVSDGVAIREHLGDNFDLTQINTIGCLADLDLVTTEPLYIGVDFGGRINAMVVGQYLPGINRFNFIKDFFVKSPETIDELAQLFINYYSRHPQKLVRFRYDVFGNQNVGNSKRTYAEQFSDALKDAGWTVIPETSGQNPQHHLKYALYNMIFSDKPPVTISYNYYNCMNLIQSIESVQIKERDGEIKKDKSREGKNPETEERQPHLSDAMDYIIFPLFQSALTQETEFYENSYR